MFLLILLFRKFTAFFFYFEKQIAFFRGGGVDPTPLVDASTKNASFIFTAEYFASGGHSGLFEIYFYEVHISRTYK